MGKPDTLSQRLDHSTETSNNKDIILLHPEMFTVWALKGIKLEEAKKNILSNIYKDNHNGDQEEHIAQAACELQQFSNWMVHSMEWSNIDGLLHF